MFALYTGLLLFFAPHLLRELGWREPVMARLPSEAAYKGLYTLVALTGLGLIIWGKANAEFIMIWQPVYEWRSYSLIAMLPALVFLVAGNLPMSYIRYTLNHPMLVGVAIWGLAHLWANGDLASMLLFGSFALWAIIKIYSLGVPVPRPSPRLSWLAWDTIAIIGGCLAYLLLFIYHGQLFGVGLSLE